MLIEMSVACAVGAVIAVQAQRRNEERRHWQRREQLLIQGLRQRGIDGVALKRPHLSQRSAEMECLLQQLRGTAESLAAALSVEAGFERNSGTADTESQILYEQWQLARAAVEEAQGAYDQAVNDYREFVHALPGPLRAKAAERGTVAMQLSPA